MNNQEKKTILLVQGAASLSMAEDVTIEGFGYKVITANTGEKAIESALSNTTISLILMDIDLGEVIDGPEVARQILEKRNIPIVFLTSHSEKEYVDKVKEITHYGYVIKNSGDFVLRSSIEMALELFDTHTKAKEREESLLGAEIIAGFGSWEFNLSMKTVNASEGARRIYGLGDKEWTIEEVQKIPLPEYRSMLDAALLGLVKQGIPYDVEFKVLRSSDNKRIDIHSIARYDPLRNVVTGTIQDITDRKQAEEELYRTNTFLDSIVENIPNMLFLKDVKELRFVRFNRAGEELLGYSRNDLLGKNDYDFFQKEQADFFREKDRAVLRGKNVVDIPEETIQTRFQGERILHTKKVPILNNYGEPEYLLGISEDITERKYAEEALTREKEKLETLSDNAPFGMVLIDKEGHFTYINRKFTEIFGYHLSDIPDGKIWFQKAYPNKEYRHTAISAWREDLADAKPGERIPRVFTVSGMDGTQRIVQFISSVLTSGGYLMTCEDITELKHVESQLRQAQKMEAIGTLAGGIAHDFNNILTALMGYTALIQIKMDASDPLRTYVDEVLTASQKAVDLTQSLLAFSRQQSVTLVPLNMNNTIKVAEKLLRRLLTEDIALHTSLTEDDTVVMADKSQMDQILFNLVTNARDAMPKGGVLTIKTAVISIDNTFIKIQGFGEPGKYVRISITDTGVGMDEITRQKIFDPFFTTKEIGKGTGLGLATVYGIVKTHNGYITVESTSNHGTTFHIYLPQVNMEVAEIEDTIIPSTRGTETILIAEDNEGVRRFMREALRGQGYTIREAVDGEDAIEKFKQHRDIDLIIIDSVMPRKNGRETYEEIHSIDPHIKVLFTSGYTKDIVLDKGVEDEKFDFIAKPTSLNKFLQKVREVLEKYASQIRE